MDTKKPQDKNGTYPPAPSVEDDTSPSSSSHDLDDDCEEFDEAYLQAYIAYKHLCEDSDQEEEVEAEEKEAEETPQILIEYLPDALSSTSSPPPQANPPNQTPPAAHREHVAIPLDRQYPSYSRHRHGVHTSPVQPRAIQEAPLIHQTTPRLLRTPSHPISLRQSHPSRYLNRPRHPVAHHMNTSDSYADHATILPRHFHDPRIAQRFPRTSCSGVRYVDVLPRRGTVSDGYLRRYPENEGGRAYGGDGGGVGVREADVFERFVEVFNVMRRIDADIVALKKVLEGLLLERFGGRG